MHDSSSSRVFALKFIKCLTMIIGVHEKYCARGTKVLEIARNGNYMFVGCITYLFLVRESNQISEYLIINI